MVFHWSLSDSKSPQVSRTLLSILAVLNNAVVWMVSTRPPTSKSSSPFSNPLVTVPNAPITIGIIVTCMFHGFFNSLAWSRYLSFFSHFFQFYSVVSRDSKVDYFASSLFLFCCCWLLLSLVFWPGLSDPFVYYYYHYYSMQVFHWSMTNSKTPQITRTLLSIQANFTWAVIWWISILSMVSISHSFFSRTLRAFQRTQICFLNRSR